MSGKKLTIDHIVHDDRDEKAARQAAISADSAVAGVTFHPVTGDQMVTGHKKGSAPGFTPELGNRLHHAIEELGGLMAASRKLQRSKDALAKWRDGVSKVSLADLVELAVAAKVDPVWLAFGDGVVGHQPYTVPVDTIRESWDFWMPVILRLKDRPDPDTLREQFIADVIERAARRNSGES